jgi:SAM-dependent methyltransferase
MPESVSSQQHIGTSATLPSSRADFQSFFSVKIKDLAELGAHTYAGIYCPEDAYGAEKLGLTEQFTDKADEYDRKYFNVDYFKQLVIRATKDLSIPENAVVLDLGSGSGNTVFAALDLFPACFVIATDLSEQLLRILQGHVKTKREYVDRLFLMCQDVSVDTFARESMDLVLGGAILHHLIDPSQAIIAALRALKPGGYAIFFEPFENGASILRLAIKEILKINETHPQRLESEIKTFLKAVDYDYKVRTGTDKSAPIFKKIDDKWLFTRSYFENCAQIAGASDLKIQSLYQGDRTFSFGIEGLLRAGLERKPDALPEWAWNVLREYDTSFSPDLLKDMFVEGCVIIRK